LCPAGPSRRFSAFSLAENAPRTPTPSQAPHCPNTFLVTSPSPHWTACAGSIKFIDPDSPLFLDLQAFMTLAARSRSRRVGPRQRRGRSSHWALKFPVGGNTSMATVKDILAVKGTQVLSIGPEASVLDAALLMNEHKIGSLVVMTGGQILGI